MSFDQQSHTAWERFIIQNEVPSDVPLQIAGSWERCRMHLSPLTSQLPIKLSPEHMLSAQVAKFDFISISRPILEDIHQFIEGSTSAVILVNSACYILDMVSDPDIQKIANQSGLVKGSSLSEYQAGTNAFSLALLERVPVQVIGSEHYLIAFHQFADSAAPIFDLTGTPLGALGVLTLESNSHPHSLGLAVSGARAIEAQCQSEYLLGEQNRQLASLNAILSAVAEGILVWNEDDIIIHANDAAVEILGLPTELLMGNPVHECIQFPDSIREAIAGNNALSDIEVLLNVEDHPASCLISLRYVFNSAGMRTVVAILHQTKHVRELVQRQFGTHAVLTLDTLIGDNPAIRRVRRLAKTAAAARASVLIRGEHGTGKNSLARAIHNHGPRREAPFIAFAAASMPGELIIPELLGFEEGGEYGLDSSRPSKCELADGGTIFFPDIESLPMEAQTALLNVLELGIVQRIGSKRAIEVDVRAIAATSRDMEQLIASGAFRADLFYRLHPFEIHLPPLREHKDDLPLLVQDILKRISRKHRRDLSLSKEAMSLLFAYDWPGNVRELETSLERAAIQAGASKDIHPEHLPDYIRYVEYIQLDSTPIDTLEDLQRSAILDAARSSRGNVSQMAKILGIGRTTVWRRLKEYQISPDEFRN
ncbi:MAG: sigma 54-interacting transcriptional regulator [Chloroflexota bacterium]|nr:sigma 54-interacting transcriptional regulator [Chloroflexota bacterium]